MTRPLPQLTDEELPQAASDDEPGFGSLATTKGLLPLRAMDIQGRIDGRLSQVTIRQTFVNPFDEPLEATYIFPLPDRAAVRGFRMEVGGRTIQGTLEERAKAGQDYDTAITAGKRAAIAEEERPGVFTDLLDPWRSKPIHGLPRFPASRLDDGPRLDRLPGRFESARSSG